VNSSRVLGGRQRKREPLEGIGLVSKALRKLQETAGAEIAYR
jgi:hypothetical protein